MQINLKFFYRKHDFNQSHFVQRHGTTFGKQCYNPPGIDITGEYEKNYNGKGPMGIGDQY